MRVTASVMLTCLLMLAGCADLSNGPESSDSSQGCAQGADCDRDQDRDRTQDRDDDGDQDRDRDRDGDGTGGGRR